MVTTLAIPQLQLSRDPMLPSTSLVSSLTQWKLPTSTFTLTGTAPPFTTKITPKTTLTLPPTTINSPGPSHPTLHQVLMPSKSPEPETLPVVQVRLCASPPT